MNKELSNMNLILYHGSPVDFDEFTNEGLGVEKEQGMAVTAGYYFTNLKNMLFRMALYIKLN